MAQQNAQKQTAERNRGALDWLNFFLADVKDGIGPFLAIFLTSSQHWDPGRAGIALTIGGVATVLARGPVGALVDAITWKRTLIVVSAAAVAASSIAMAIYPEFWPVAFAQGLNGIADAIFPLAVTAISLGIVGRKGFTSRIGRNEAWNHAGNVATAVLAGAAGYFIAQGAVLWIVAALSIASAIAVYRLDPRAINHDIARGEEEGTSQAPEALKLLFANKPLLWFTAAITLFHFANAAMLPLAGEKLSLGKPEFKPALHGVLRGHRAACHGADSDSRRPQSRRLGPQTAVPRRFRGSADPRSFVRTRQRSLLHRGHSDPGRRGRGHLWRSLLHRGLGFYARHRPLQFGPRRSRGELGPGGCAQQRRCGNDRQRLWLFGGLFLSCRMRPWRARHLFPARARVP